MKPSVILYKALPDDLQKRLEEHFTVTQVKNLSPETVAQHAGRSPGPKACWVQAEKVDVALLAKNAEASCYLNRFRGLRQF